MTTDYTQTEMLLCKEPCNCEGRVMHNNGGNHHRKQYLEVFCCKSQYVIILLDTSSRETFPREEYERLHFTGQEFEIVREYPGDDDQDTIARFRQGEAEIIAQFTE